MRAEFIVLIIGVGIAAVFTRFISIFVFSHTGMPVWLERWLKHIPIAVFSALIASAILVPHGQFNMSFNNYYLWSGAIAIILAWRYHNFMLTVGAGTLVMLGLHWMLH